MLRACGGCLCAGCAQGLSVRIDFNYLQLTLKIFQDKETSLI